MKRIGSLILLLIPLTLVAQVVNTEKLRGDDDQKGWDGLIDLTFGFTKNTVEIIRASPEIRLDYQDANNRFIFLNGLALSRATTNFVNKGYSHLRYNREINPTLTWEAFGQVQYNEIQLIALRNLWGTGPRFRLVQNDTARLYVAALYMYEYEEEWEESAFHRDHRMSAYISAGYTVTDKFFLDQIVYYQPRLDNWRDYRVASETVLNINVTSRFSFNLSLSVWFDSRVAKIRDDVTNEVERAPDTIISFSNSLVYRF